ncbi:aspartate/glutamate racemase family protein [Rhizobium sp. L1K21]|uniref:aspartate/glutamate racemase family protein n=1 Tax=Rhizobium sp. L1K21 TaxID=2954933 RepID=UPI002092118B|nr:aspartate/glutamate racemase family protein [Rhizobium sp. L1K21]MCO6188458.1 aspartate/glutamate racemase family protein [Rhizobium sp. L1K21]
MSHSNHSGTVREIKMLVANIGAVPKDSAGGRYVRDALVPVTQQNAALAAQADTQCTFRFASEGISHPAFEKFKYLPLLNPKGMVEAVAWAQEEGYDAAILGCFGDPFLDEIRDKSQIPVIGFGEAAILAAARIGPFGIVANSPLLVEPIRGQVDRLGLTDRLVGIVATCEPMEEQEHALIDARGLFPRFRSDVATLIESGARALIPACGIMSAALRVAPGYNGNDAPLTAVDGIPVIDVVGEAVLAAERAVLTGVIPAPLVHGQSGSVEHPDASMPSGAFWNCH